MGRSSVYKSLADIWDWWWRVARAMPLARGKAGLYGTTVTLSRNRLVLSKASGRARTEVGLSDMASGLSQARRGFRGFRGPVTLALEPDRFVTRQLSPFSVPLSRQRQMAELDLAASTPFAPGEVHAVLADKRGLAGEDAKYHIIRKQVVDPVIAALRQARLPVRNVVLADGNGGVMALRGREKARVLGKTRAYGLRRTAGIIAAAVMAVAVTGTFAHAWWRYDRAIAEVSAQSDTLQVRARKVRTALDEREKRLGVLAALRTQIAKSQSATEIWEELSRVLPDTAWLTDMTVTPDRVRIAGFAKEAAAIVAPLEGSPMFENAEFTSAVVRVPGQSGERFSLQMGLVQR